MINRRDVLSLGAWASVGLAMASRAETIPTTATTADKSPINKGKSVRGMGSKKKRAYVKQATLELKPGLPVTVLVVHGLAHVREVIERIKAGKLKATFIEVMACEGGCIGGGGQPRAKAAPYVSRAMRQARIAALSTDDARGTLRFSHENPEIQALYRDFYGKPLSAKAEKMLHTQYASRAKDLG